MSSPAQLDERQQSWVESAASRVPKLARVMVNQLPKVDVNDLESAGNEALVRAAFRYSPDTGVPFGTYAHYRIRGAMLDCARAEDKAGRQARRAAKNLEASQALLKEASESEAGKAQSLADRVRAAKALVDKTAAAVLMGRASKKDVEQVAGEASPNAEQALLDREQKASLLKCLDGLDEDQRALIQAVYFEGVTMQTFSERINKSLSTVSRRHSKLLGILATRMKAQDAKP